MRYYPVEFIAAMLNSVMGINEKVAFYISFAESLGIQVLPPDINESRGKFTVKGDTVRFGLAAIKNAGVNVVESIVRIREEKGRFIDFSDFCNKIDFSSINKRAIESLIKAGAFDCLKVYRSQLLSVYEKVLDGINNERKRNIDGQISLFSTLNEQQYESIKIKYPNIKEFEKRHILSMEKEMTGIYISGHPLMEYESSLRLQTDTKISDIVINEALEEGLMEESRKVKDEDRVVIGGIITEVSRKITRNNDKMAFIKVEDMTGTMEVVIFPKTYEKYKQNIEEDKLVVLGGRVSIKEEEQPKLLCESIKPLIKITDEKLYILIEEDKLVRKTLKDIRELLLSHSGSIPVYICTNKERKKYRLDRELWVNGDEELLDYLKESFGESNIKLL